MAGDGLLSGSEIGHSFESEKGMPLREVALELESYITCEPACHTQDFHLC